KPEPPASCPVASLISVSSLVLSWSGPCYDGGSAILGYITTTCMRNWERGELFERIVDDNFEHTEPASVRYMQQILEGIAFMHQQNIVHLDLKPENIVCVDTTGTSIKIIDFGLASKLGTTRKNSFNIYPSQLCWICVFSFVSHICTDGNTALKVMHGTPEFVAPEVINYEPVCLATDMWSIGVICYIL
ncbi:hypothetical protein XENOCAPTIV_021101, partial [Xenoophorus captivus]